MDERASNEPVIDPEEILEGIQEWVEIETPSHLGEEVNESELLKSVNRD